MRHVAGLALLLALLAGCFADPPTPAGTGRAAVRSDDVTLRTVTGAEYDRFLTDQRGQVVVIDVWADWCLTCKKEFPNFVNLHNQYADKGVLFVSVSLDEDANREKTLKFLRSSKAKFPNLLLNESVDDWQKRFDTGGPPVTCVYDKDGKLVKRWQGASYEKDVEPVLKKLVGE